MKRLISIIITVTMFFSLMPVVYGSTVPAGLHAAVARHNGILMEWYEVAGAEKYELSRGATHNMGTWETTDTFYADTTATDENASYEYSVRAYVNGAWSDYSDSVFVSITPGSENIALNKTATSNAEDNNPWQNGKAKAVDGSYDTDATRWVSKSVTDAYLELDLGNTYTFDSAEIYSGYQKTSAFLKNYNIEYYENGEWKAAYHTENGGAFKQVALFKPVSSDKVRLHIFNSPSDNIRLYEFMLFEAGGNSGETTTTPSPTEYVSPTQTTSPTATVAPTPTVAPTATAAPTATPEAYGESFKIYANPDCALNTMGTSYFYGVAKGRRLVADGNDLFGRFFHWGDGMMFEPYEGHLDGYNTRIIVGHYISVNASDLCAEVIYKENGNIKVSKSFGFTGYHANGLQTGTNNEFSEYYIGTFPDVVSVNIWQTTEKEGQVSTDKFPKFGYVQFDVMGNAGEISEADMYVERRVKSSYSRGKKIAEPSPTAVPPLAGATQMPFVTPAPKVYSDTVSLGMGGSITMYPANYDGISLGDNSEFTFGNFGAILKDGATAVGPFTLTDTADFVNMGKSVATVKIGNSGKITGSTANACFSRNAVNVSAALGSSVLYTPKEGLFQGTEAKIDVIYMGRNSTCGLDAIITYDGGKTDTVMLNPAGTALSGTLELLNAGIYKNIESVEITVTSNGQCYLPSCVLTVVNDDLTKPTPEINRKIYQIPDIAQITAPVPSSMPTENAESFVSINEVCSDNKGSLTDALGKKSDWIELYNSGDEDINLAGYGLTDNVKKPFKWVFPETVIPSKGYLTVFASSNNTVIDGEIHTNFNISKDGEPIMLSNPEGGVISIIDLPAIQTDKTMARIPDGSNALKIAYATPSAQNTENSVISSFVPLPQFSAESGFYENPFDLSVTSTAGAEIHYTLDGSIPDINSPVIGQSLNIYNKSNDENGISAFTYKAKGETGNNVYVPTVKIDKATLLNAIAIDSSGNSSEIVTKTYFVGLNIKDNYNNEAVISVSADSSAFFDGEEGIFTHPLERSNLFDAPVHMTMFEGDGKVVLDQGCKISVRGLGARGEDQKSLTFKASGDYGPSTFDYDIFRGKAVSKVNGKRIKSYGSFALRGGLDGSRSKGERWMDPAMQERSKTLDTAWQSGRGCILFINGEYWGHYYIQERVGTDYVEAHYGVDEDDVILFKTTNAKGDATIDDAELRANDIRWLQNTDFSTEENYRQLEAKFDIPQMLIYYAVNLACQNLDWGSYNFAMWRSRNITDAPYEDGKWRFLLYDLDACYINGTSTPVNMLNDAFVTAIRSNESLKKRFIHTLTDVYTNWYDTLEVIDDMLYWSDELHTVLDAHWDRWGKPAYTYSPYGSINNVLSLKPYYIKTLREQFGLTGEFTHLNVRTNDEEMGTFKVNDLPEGTVGASYNGWYFNDYTVTLEAIPKDGYEFIGWQVSEGASVSDENGFITDVSIPDNGAHVVALFAEKEKSVSIIDGNIVTSGVNDNAVLVIASYNGTELKDIKFVEISEDVNLSISSTGLNTGDNTMQNAFLVKDVANISPLCSPAR